MVNSIGFLGAGQMSFAMIKGLVEAKAFVPSSIFVSDPYEDQLRKCEKLGAVVTKSNTFVVETVEVVVLCVKPNIVVSVLQEISKVFTHAKLIISIAAGITITTLEKYLPEGSRVVRAMPNTAALARASATAFGLGSNASAADASTVARIFKPIGTVHQVEEKLMDAVVGLSGSGPAYVFLFIEALADGGVRCGLPRALAYQLAVQTLIGSCALVQETGKHPGDLKDAVCSPGGTTIAAVQELENGAFRGTVMKAVYASAQRASEFARAKL